LGSPEGTTLLHISPKTYDNHKYNKLIISLLMNTNIKLGERKKLERCKKIKNKTYFNPIIAFNHIQKPK
jgi:hypothetical protein